MSFLPVLKQVPSPNFSERATQTIDLVVCHDCEGSYAGSISWFAQKQSQVSAHLVLKEDGTECTQMVPFAKKAWHACDFNSRSIGVEIAGYAKAGFSADELNVDAYIVAWLLRKFNIPCQWAGKGATQPGFCSHFDLGAAGGGHNDLTTDPAVWAAFAARVKGAYDAMTAAPLPQWAFTMTTPMALVSAPPPAPAGFVPTSDARSDEPAILLPVWPPETDEAFFGSAATFLNEWLALKVSMPFAVAMTTMVEFETAFKLTAVGDQGRAYNGYQWWWNPRGAAILAATGIDIRTETSIKRIVTAAWWELNGPLKKARDAISNCTTAHDAAIAACTFFEGAGAPNAAARRGLGAERWSVWFSNNQEFVRAHPAQG